MSKDGVSWLEIEDVPPGIDTDFTNELQLLSVSGDTLFISDGNFVVLPGQEGFGLPFEVGTSDTINQPIAATIGGSTSYINNSVWQSFLSSVNGKITSIQTVFNNISDVSINVKIYPGEGVGNQFIASFTFPAEDYPPLVSPVLQTFDLPSPLEISNGQKYTFQITGNVSSGGDEDDLEFITSGTSNPYTFGQSSIGPETDLQFTVNADIINEFSLVVSQTGNLDVPNGRITDKTGFLMPVGSILPFAGPKENVPEGFFFCEGQCLDKNVYPELYASIGDYWSTCDDQTQFRLPDLRGAFLRGVSHESDKDPDKDDRIDLQTGEIVGNQVGSYQYSEIKAHAHGIDHDHVPVDSGTSGNHAHNVKRGLITSIYWEDSSNAFNQAGWTNNTIDASGSSGSGTILQTQSGGDHTHSVDLPNYQGSSSNEGGSESRPFNAYVNYIIKY